MRADWSAVRTQVGDTGHDAVRMLVPLKRGAKAAAHNGYPNGAAVALADRKSGTSRRQKRAGTESTGEF